MTYTQVYTAFVADAGDTVNEIIINCTHIAIDTFNISLYNPMLFCVDIGEPLSCVEQKTLQRILRKSNREDIPRECSDKFFRFGDTSVKSLGVIELRLETQEHIPDTPVFLDVVPLNMPAFLDLDVLDCHSLLTDNATNRSWNRIIVSESPLLVIYESSVHMIRADDHLCVPLKPFCSHFYSGESA